MTALEPLIVLLDEVLGCSGSALLQAGGSDLVVLGGPSTTSDVVGDALARIAAALPVSLTRFRLVGVPCTPQAFLQQLLERCPQLEALEMPGAEQRSPGLLGGAEARAPEAAAQQLTRAPGAWALEQLPATLRELRLTECRSLDPSSLTHLRALTGLTRLCVRGLRVPPARPRSEGALPPPQQPVRNPDRGHAPEVQLAAAGSAGHGSRDSGGGAAGGGTAAGDAAAVATPEPVAAAPGVDKLAGCPVAASMQHWTRLTRLQELELVGQPGPDPGDPWDALLPAFLPSLDALSRLAFHPPTLRDAAAALAPLELCVSLRRLELGGCAVSPLALADEAWRALAAAPALEQLLLGHCDPRVGGGLLAAGAASGVAAVAAGAAAAAAAAARSDANLSDWGSAGWDVWARPRGAGADGGGAWGTPAAGSAWDTSGLDQSGGWNGGRHATPNTSPLRFGAWGSGTDASPLTAPDTGTGAWDAAASALASPPPDVPTSASWASTPGTAAGPGSGAVWCVDTGGWRADAARTGTEWGRKQASGAGCTGGPTEDDGMVLGVHPPCRPEAATLSAPPSPPPASPPPSPPPPPQAVASALAAATSPPPPEAERGGAALEAPALQADTAAAAAGAAASAAIHIAAQMAAGDGGAAGNDNPFALLPPMQPAAAAATSVAPPEPPSSPSPSSSKPLAGARYLAPVGPNPPANGDGPTDAVLDHERRVPETAGALEPAQPPTPVGVNSPAGHAAESVATSGAHCGSGASSGTSSLAGSGRSSMAVTGSGVSSSGGGGDRRRAPSDSGYSWTSSCNTDDPVATAAVAAAAAAAAAAATAATAPAAKRPSLPERRRRGPVAGQAKPPAHAASTAIARVKPAAASSVAPHNHIAGSGAEPCCSPRSDSHASGAEVSTCGRVSGVSSPVGEAVVVAAALSAAAAYRAAGDGGLPKEAALAAAWDAAAQVTACAADEDAGDVAPQLLQPAAPASKAPEEAAAALVAAIESKLPLAAPAAAPPAAPPSTAAAAAAAAVTAYMMGPAAVGTAALGMLASNNTGSPSTSPSGPNGKGLGQGHGLGMGLAAQGLTGQATGFFGCPFAMLTRLSLTRIGDGSLASLAGCRQLQVRLRALSVADCGELGAGGLQAIPRLRRLEQLSLLGLTDTYDAVLGGWTGLDEIRALELGMSRAAAAAAAAATAAASSLSAPDVSPAMALPAGASGAAAPPLLQSAQGAGGVGQADADDQAHGGSWCAAGAGKGLLGIDDLRPASPSPGGADTLLNRWRDDTGKAFPGLAGCLPVRKDKPFGLLSKYGYDYMSLGGIGNIGGGSGSGGGGGAGGSGVELAEPLDDDTAAVAAVAAAGGFDSDGGDAGSGCGASRGSGSSNRSSLWGDDGHGDAGSDAVDTAPGTNPRAGKDHGHAWALRPPRPRQRVSPSKGKSPGKSRLTSRLLQAAQPHAAKPRRSWRLDGVGKRPPPPFPPAAGAHARQATGLEAEAGAVARAGAGAEAEAAHEGGAAVGPAGGKTRSSSRCSSIPDLVDAEPASATIDPWVAHAAADAALRACGAAGACPAGWDGVERLFGGVYNKPRDAGGYMYGSAVGGGGGAAAAASATARTAWRRPLHPTGVGTRWDGTVAGGDGSHAGAGAAATTGLEDWDVDSDANAAVRWASPIAVSPGHRHGGASAASSVAGEDGDGDVSATEAEAEDGRVHGGRRGAALCAAVAAAAAAAEAGAAAVHCGAGPEAPRLTDNGLQVCLQLLPRLKELNLHNLPHLTPGTLEQVLSRSGLRALAVDGCCQITRDVCELLAISAMDLTAVAAAAGEGGAGAWGDEGLRLQLEPW